MAAPLALSCLARITRLCLLGVLWLTGSTVVQAAEIPVPNGSFENPATSFATNTIDVWQDYPKPPWYDESGGYSWDQLTGVFANSAPTNADHIVNCHGAQAVFVFAVPGSGFFQDNTSVDHQQQSLGINQPFEVGKAYEASMGLIGGGGGMQPGTSLLLGLYYRDASSNTVLVAQTNIIFDLSLFPTTTQFVTIKTSVPTVRPGDPWAGMPIGIQVLSTVGFDKMGGYWDVDNVRLRSVQAPVLAATVSGTNFSLTIRGEIGQRYEVLSAATPGVPVAGWTVEGQVTNLTGTVVFTQPWGASGPRFFRTQVIE